MSFGPGASSGMPPRKAPPAALGDPFLAGAEVVDEAEGDVVHRRSVGDREREGEERDRALRVDRPVDRIDDDAELATAPEGAHAELLGDERQIAGRAPRAGRTTAVLGRRRRSRSCRRRPRRHGARARARARVGSSARTPSRSATQARQNASQSVTGRPDGRGARRAAWGRSTSSSAASSRRGVPCRRRPRSASARRSSAQSASPDSTRRTASTRSGVYEIPSWPSRSTSSTSSSPGAPCTSLVESRPHENRSRARVRLVERAPRRRVLDRRERLAGEIDVLPSRRRPGGSRRSRDPGRRARRARPSSGRRRPPPRIATPSRSGGGRRRSGAGGRRTPTRRPARRGTPEARARDLEVRRVVGRRDRRAVVEQEDRLELGPRCLAADEGDPPSGPRACARAEARCPSRTARRAATRRARCADARRRPGRRSPARAPRSPARPRARARPSASHCRYRSPARRSSGSSVRCTTLCGSRARNSSSVASSITSYGGAVSAGLGRA